MTFKQPMIKYSKDEDDTNIGEIEKFAKYFDTECIVEFDEENNTVIIQGSNNLSPQRLWIGEYLIYDDVENLFSIGTINDYWGWKGDIHADNTVSMYDIVRQRINSKDNNLLSGEELHDETIELLDKYKGEL